MAIALYPVWGQGWRFIRGDTLHKYSFCSTIYWSLWLYTTMPACLQIRIVLRVGGLYILQLNIYWLLFVLLIPTVYFIVIKSWRYNHSLTMNAAINELTYVSFVVRKNESFLSWVIMHENTAKSRHLKLFRRYQNYLSRCHFVMIRMWYSAWQGIF